MSMLREEIRQIVQASVLETLDRLGFTTDDPAAVQRDMIFLRRSRTGQEELGGWIRRTAIGVGVSGILYLLWDALAQAISLKH